MEFPEDHYLQIPPPLLLKDFQKNPVITDFNYLFTKSQIQYLNGRREVNEIEDLSLISIQAKSLIEDLKILSESINKKLADNKKEEIQFPIDLSDSEYNTSSDSWNPRREEIVKRNYDLVDSVSQIDGELIIKTERL